MSRDDVLTRLRFTSERARDERAVALNEALLLARARRLSRPRAGDAPEAGKEVLCCRLGDERYGIPLPALSEVGILERWSPVPGQPQYVLGVTNLRGEIRPVLDLHQIYGIAPPASGAVAWVAFIRMGRGGGEVGLRVDGLDRVVVLDDAQVTRPSQTANGLPQKPIAGITADAMVLIDIEQVLALEALGDSRPDARRTS